ncbi:MAG: ATP-dependent Clp protease adaptor ClpS [Humidesulfovibrio sp.]|uniref:ATP-dependent Clp protease adaptor ClpS n=1 Tax=Humidesulfovibrio sp. TaxID=2910988 RepID=UPI0027E7E6A1|nr:ATP-dependent Clp protease adaptor ClpS [Humidesulfovibrio sp.]MDQ7834534.1 ATP-dependent Clp protease adaptor ClpS [Humidesulfovibrio sp.]
MSGQTDTRNAPGLFDESELREPRRFKVLLHNDDYTSMEFVVHVLRRVFQKPEHEATRIMLAVHQQGMGECGVYTAEVAETKVDTVHVMAKAAGFPLRASMEEV